MDGENEYRTCTALIAARLGQRFPDAPLERRLSFARLAFGKGTQVDPSDLVAQAATLRASGDEGAFAWTKENGEPLIEAMRAVAGELHVDELRFALRVAVRLQAARTRPLVHRWALRRELREGFPNDVLLSAPKAAAGRQWMIERDRRTRAVSVLVIEDGEPLLAMTLGDRWVWTVRAVGTFDEDDRLQVSDGAAAGTTPLQLDRGIRLWAGSGFDVRSALDAAHRVASGQAAACTVTGPSRAHQAIVELLVGGAGGRVSIVRGPGRRRALTASNGHGHDYVERKARQHLVTARGRA